MHYEDIAKILYGSLPPLRAGFEKRLNPASAEDYATVHTSLMRLGLLLASPMPVGDEEFRESLAVIASRRQSIESALETTNPGMAAQIIQAIDDAEALLVATSAPSMVR